MRSSLFTFLALFLSLDSIIVHTSALEFRKPTPFSVGVSAKEGGFSILAPILDFSRPRRISMALLVAQYEDISIALILPVLATSPTRLPLLLCMRIKASPTMKTQQDLDYPATLAGFLFSCGLHEGEGSVNSPLPKKCFL